MADELEAFLKRPAVGLATAGLLAVDLALSWLILVARRTLDGVTVVPGLLDIRFLWNRGISFSLLWQSSSFGSWALAIFQTGVSVFLLRWAVRTPKLFLTGSLVCIAAGALGNVASRLFYGAVFDYFEFHLGDVPFFVFNISDVLISAGVVGILVETVWPTRWTLPTDDTAGAPGA
jgi:signal peptidase II